jgi:site-specific DNA-methyltransferase (cytosine-N4-specific)
MIGNREITDRRRREYWAEFEATAKGLPTSVTSLVHRVNRLNAGADVGFRRKNLSALLARYFFDMRRVMAEMRDLVKAGGNAFVVVGNNRTIAGGQAVEIETAELLGDLAESVGWIREEGISMEMLVSRDIFRRNAIGSESILRLRKP